jgi:hypothetical protein
MRPASLSGLFAAFAILASATPVQAQFDPAAKVPPNPTQGIISPSGKFMAPVNSSTSSALPAKTPAEAEAALRQALHVQWLGSNTFRLGLVEFDKERRIVTLPARVCIRTQVVEYALVAETGKIYESLLATEASPVDVHLAFLLLGVSQVPLVGDLKQPAPIPDTNALRIDVIWQTNGLAATFPLSALVSLTDGRPEAPGRPLSLEKWLYNGSEFDQWGFAAQREGSLVALIRDPAALVNNPGADRDNDLIHLPNTRLVPGQGTPVRVVLRLPERAPPSPPPASLPGVTPVTPLSTNRY